MEEIFLNNQMETNGNMEGGTFRVVLYSIGRHTEMEKVRFCKEVSEHYGIPISLMEKIVDRCPVVIKKDLPFKKARFLAIAFNSFGASVSVEKKKNLLPISLEFSTDRNGHVELESSHLRKSPGGTWQILGRVRNIFKDELFDIWVLIQLFDEFGDLIAFEEIPLPVNPLPQNESSPFRAIFEENLPIHKISISFKNASGSLLLARDNREKKEWVEMKIVELEKRTSRSPSDIIPETVLPPIITLQPSLNTESEVGRLEGEGTEQVFEEIKPVEQERLPSWSDREIRSGVGEIPSNHPEGHEPQKETVTFECLQEEPETTEIIWPLIEKEGEDRAEELSLDDQADDRLEEKYGWVDPGLSQSQEADPSLVTYPTNLEEKKEKEEIHYPWIEEFRKTIIAYEHKGQDPFTVWFDHLQQESGFESIYHALLTLLSYTRFNQTHSSNSALENTRKIYNLSLSNDLSIEEIPSLDGTPFFSGELWRDLYFRAIPKLLEVTRRILEKREWDPFDLDRLIRIIPHMTDQNSRWTIRFIHDRIPGVTTDLSLLSVEITEGLYRVASRLGVVNPFFDHYQGNHSMGYLKIQSFARFAFPDDPGKVEGVMSRLGAGEEEGHCSPTEPRCQRCPFESFCQKLFSGFNPAEKGMLLQS